MGSGRFRHGGDDPVPGRVAKGIIVRFKAVNVKHADGKRNSQPEGLLPLCGTVTLVAAPVGNPSQLVRHRLPLRLPAVMVELHMRIHPGPYHRGAEGLCDIIHRPQYQPVLLVLHIGEARNQNDGNALGDNLLLQFL